MCTATQAFYDGLADDYHLMFEDWDSAIEEQAAVISKILKSACGGLHTLSILDCACGIGTQTLGLARLGYNIVGCDLSPMAIQRASQESRLRKLNVRFMSVDMLNLAETDLQPFNAVICMDNVFPHFDSDDLLAHAARELREKLKPGGVLITSIRDYDRLILERPTIQGPFFFGSQGARRISLQIWDWFDQNRYRFHIVFASERSTGWQIRHHTSTYRALLQEELVAILKNEGFTNMRWILPAECGYHQPILLAHRT